MLDAFLNAADFVLGWLLVLPGPLPAVSLAVLSAVLMVLIRRKVTDQPHLARCVADKKCLTGLIRQARRRKDKSAVRRHKTVRNRVQLKLLRAEGWPLLLSIPIIGVLGTWGYYRLEYHAPVAREAVVLELSLPPTAVGDLATLVPADGLESEGWISRVETGRGEPAHGVARWQVRGEARGDDYRLQVRHGRETFTHPLRVGQPTYADPVRQHDDRFLLPQSAVRMRPMKVLGFIPWFSPATATGMFLPAWLITYVLVVVPLVYLLKAALRVY
ncbi:MAG: hypothetical protein ACLFV7_08225 [Phycisphaerae bacterium]